MRTPETHRFGRRAMGSPLSLTVVAPRGRAAAERAWQLVSDEFEVAEQAMSRFRDSSDLTLLNRAAGSGSPLEVDRRLIQALVAADRAGRLTEGRFDARVLADLERLGYHGIDLGPNAGPAADPGAGRASERVIVGCARTRVRRLLRSIGQWTSVGSARA